MFTLTLCRFTRFSPPSSHNCCYERLPTGTRLSKSFSQEEASKTSGHQPVRLLFLGDASASRRNVLPYHFVDGYKLNVGRDSACIANWLGWEGEIAEVALFEGRDPYDPEYPRLKPVGVYPVIDGWAHINLEQVAGKGQDYYSPLYIAPGCALMKRLGLGLQRRLHRLNFVEARANKVLCPGLEIVLE